MADNAGLSSALDGIPMVADAAARDARFPLATRKQNQRVFRLDTGVQQRWSGSAWVDDVAQTFSVRASGAVGDGVTDDTGAVQEAVDACVAAGGGLVLLPPGIYKTTTTVTVSGPDVHLLGFAGSILRPSAASFNVLTLASTAHRTAIVGVRIEGAATDSTTSQYGIFTNAQAAPNDVRIEGVTFSGQDSSHGLNSGVLCDGLGVSNYGLRWRLLNNHVEQLWSRDTAPQAGYGFLLSRAWYALVSGNTFVGGTGRSRHALYLGNVRHGRFVGNQITSFANGNIVLGDYNGTDALPGAEQNIIGFNIIKQGGVDANGVAGIGLYGLARHNLVIGNVIDGFKGRASIEVSKAATTQQPVDNTVSTNVIVNGDQFGINVQGALRTVVRGNDLRDGSLLSPGTYTAIKVQQDNATTASDTTTVESNHASGTGWRSGCSLDSTAPVPVNTVILSNYFPAFGTFPIEGNGVGYVGGNNQGAADPISGDRGDASVTLTVGTSEEVQRFATTLTANRTVTLSTTNAHKGAKFRVVRTGLGAFTLDVGGLKTIPSATAAYVDVMHTGSAWVLVGYGAL